MARNNIFQVLLFMLFLGGMHQSIAQSNKAVYINATQGLGEIDVTIDGSVQYSSASLNWSGQPLNTRVNQFIADINAAYPSLNVQGISSASGNLIGFTLETPEEGLLTINDPSDQFGFSFDEQLTISENPKVVNLSDRYEDREGGAVDIYVSDILGSGDIRLTLNGRTIITNERIRGWSNKTYDEKMKSFVNHVNADQRREIATVLYSLAGNIVGFSITGFEAGAIRVEDPLQLFQFADEDVPGAYTHDHSGILSSATYVAPENLYATNHINIYVSSAQTIGELEIFLDDRVLIDSREYRNISPRTASNVIATICTEISSRRNITASPINNALNEVIGFTFSVVGDYKLWVNDPSGSLQFGSTIDVTTMINPFQHAHFENQSKELGKLNSAGVLDVLVNESAGIGDIQIDIAGKSIHATAGSLVSLNLESLLNALLQQYDAEFGIQMSEVLRSEEGEIIGFRIYNRVGLTCDIQDPTGVLTFASPDDPTNWLNPLTDQTGAQSTKPAPGCFSFGTWIHNLTYTTAGDVQSESRSYMDNFGRTVQQQYRNLEADKIITQSPLFDGFGRGVGASLPAPKDGDAFCFKSDFIQNDQGNPYTWSNFDMTNTPSNLIGERENPAPVNPQAYGTLGWYYSDNNTYESHVASNDHPYSRQEFYPDPRGIVKSMGGVGTDHQLGSGHDVKQYFSSNHGELQYITNNVTNQEKWFNPASGVEEHPRTIDNFTARKTILQDENGKTSITYHDRHGNLVATCRTDVTNNCLQQKATTIIRADETREAVVHIPAATKNAGMDVIVFKRRNYEGTIAANQSEVDINDLEIKIIDLSTYTELTEGVDFVFDDANMTETPAPNSTNNNYLTVYENLRINFLGNELQKSSVYRITYDYNEGTDIDNSKVEFIKLSYELDYSHWALFEYDNHGNLVKETAPEGIDCTYDPYQSATSSWTLKSELAYDNQNNTYSCLNGSIFDENLSTTPTGFAKSVKLHIDLNNIPYPYEQWQDQVMLPNNLPAYELNNCAFQEYIQDGDWDHTIAASLAMYPNGSSISQTNSGYTFNANQELWDQVSQSTTTSQGTLTASERAERPNGGVDVDGIVNVPEPDCDMCDCSIVESDCYIECCWGGDDPCDKVEDLIAFEVDLTVTLHDANDPNNNIDIPASLSTSLYAECCDIMRVNGTPVLLNLDETYLVGKDRITVTVNGVTASLNGYTYQNLTHGYGYHDLFRFEQFAMRLQETHTPVPPAETFANAYSYDQRDQLTISEQHEEGEVENKYDDLGRLRFSQNDHQKTNDKFSYIIYDHLHRPVETGIYHSDPQSVNFGDVLHYFEQPGGLFSVETVDNIIDEQDGLLPYLKEDQHFTTYDVADALFPSSSFPSYELTYLAGNVSHTKNANSQSWYSYNELGQLRWVIKDVNGLGYKTFDYEYDDDHRLIKLSYQNGEPSESFHNHYVYDLDGRLKQYYTSLDGTLVSAELHATYHYYMHGPLKRVELAENLQGIDYVYTIHGWLKSINNPQITGRDPGQDGAPHPSILNGADPTTFAYDAFGMTIDYYDGDYTREGTWIQSHFHDPNVITNNNNQNASTGSVNLTGYEDLYNGLIKSVRWQTVRNSAQLSAMQNNNGPVNTHIDMMAFEYDDFYRLTRSTFGDVDAIGFENPDAAFTGTTDNLGFVPSTDYMVWGIDYDKNGNILSLKRNGGGNGGLSRDALTYNYHNNSNRLDFVADAADGISAYIDDFKGQTANNYGYDEIGRLIEDEGKNLLIEYNAIGKVSVVKQKSTGLRMFELAYDEHGKRLHKTSYDGNGVAISENWHLGNGGLSLIYEVDLTGTPGDYEVEYSVAGHDRLGSEKYSVINGGRTHLKTAYELKDHLGNVRVVIDSERKSDGHLKILAYNDYYPFGSVMPGSSLHPPGSLGGSRFGYQGQFNDPEINLYAFDLRQYNPHLGRWLSPDPYDQHWSPYLAMSNNPISFIDPDGGMDGMVYYIDGVRMDSDFGSMIVMAALRAEINALWGEINRMQNFERELERIVIRGGAFEDWCVNCENEIPGTEVLDYTIGDLLDKIKEFHMVTDELRWAWQVNENQPDNKGKNYANNFDLQWEIHKWLRPKYDATPAFLKDTEAGGFWHNVAVASQFHNVLFNGTVFATQIKTGENFVNPNTEASGWDHAFAGLGAVGGGLGKGVGAGAKYFNLGKNSSKLFDNANGTSGAVHRLFESSKAAFRAAKRKNNIPVSSQPIKVYTVPDKSNSMIKLPVYVFRNVKNKLIEIRRDVLRYFPKDNGIQGPHYNAGPSGGPLKQHYYYKGK